MKQVKKKIEIRFIKRRLLHEESNFLLIKGRILEANKLVTAFLNVCMVTNLCLL